MIKFEEFIESKTICDFLSSNYPEGLDYDMTVYLIMEGGNDYNLERRTSLLKRLLSEIPEGLDKEYIEILVKKIDYCITAMKESDKDSVFILYGYDIEWNTAGVYSSFDSAYTSISKLENFDDYSKFRIEMYPMNSSEFVGFIDYDKDLEICDCYYDGCCEEIDKFEEEHLEDYCPPHNRYYDLPVPFKDGDILRDIYNESTMYYLASNSGYKKEIERLKLKGKDLDTSHMVFYVTSLNPDNGDIVEDDGCFDPYNFELADINLDNISYPAKSKEDVLKTALKELQAGLRHQEVHYQNLQESCMRLRELYLINHTSKDCTSTVPLFTKSIT